MKKIANMIIGLFILLLACNNNDDLCCSEPGPSLYKLNDTSYLNYLPVCKKGTCFPGQTYKPYAIKMHNNYYMETGGFIMFGINTVVLNIKYTDYNKLEMHFNYDSLRKHVLTNEPFAEYYEENEKVSNLDKHDTSKVNQIIDANEIEKYFKRIK